MDNCNPRNGFGHYDHIMSVAYAEIMLFSAEVEVGIIMLHKYIS